MLSLLHLTLNILRNVSFVFGVWYIGYTSFYLEQKPSTSEVLQPAPPLSTQILDSHNFITKKKTKVLEQNFQAKLFIQGRIDRFLDTTKGSKKEFESLKLELANVFEERKITSSQYDDVLEQLQTKVYWDQKLSSYSDLN